MRRLRVSIFALLLTVWISSMPVLGTRCGSDCPDEGTSTRCLPGCHECVCCPAVRIAVARVILPMPLALISPLAAEALQPPIAPEPAEIAHVPKRAA